MRYIILVLALLGSLPLTISAAETYACRDNNDRLHVADNLMSLPEECRDRAETSDLNDPGKVNYVPPAVQKPQNNNDFERAVIQEQQKIEQRKRETEALISQAESLASSYKDAVIKRKAAVRSKSYGSRETIIQAEQEIERARNGKKSLLESLPQSRLTSAQREQIETQLNKIQD